MEHSNKKMIWKDGRAQEVEEKTHQKSDSNSFCIILEDGQMKRVDENTYQQWKKEKADQFATSIVQPESGQQYGVYFKGDDFSTKCQDPQVWYLVMGDMSQEDYKKLKEKHPEIEGIDEMIAHFDANEGSEENIEVTDKNWDDLKLGDFVDVEPSFLADFATQSELLKYLQENHINRSTERAYYLGAELPFKY